MKSFRFAAAIASVGVSLVMPVGAVAAGSTTTTSPITPSPPSRLTTTSPTVTSQQRGSLPNTGYDLLPETVLGLTLVGAGVGLRLRRARS